MSADYKIVLVAGQEFSVPTATADNDIRQTLVAQGFADVASADIKRTKRTVGENEVDVIEFVKKAGTKGLTGPALADLLRRTPPADGVNRGLPAVSADQKVALRRLMAGRYTIGEALDDQNLGDVLATLEELPEHPNTGTITTEETALCRTLDQLPPAAGAAPSGW